MDEPFAGMFTQGMVVHETFSKADGSYVTPAEVDIETVGNGRRARPDLRLGEEISIGRSRNVEVKAQHRRSRRHHRHLTGADTRALVMLSGFAPDRD